MEMMMMMLLYRVVMGSNVMIYIRFTAGLVQRRPLRCDGYCS